MIVDTLLAKVIGTANDRELKRIRPFVAEINSKEAEIQRPSDEELRGKPSNSGSGSPTDRRSTT
jgi:preprotein translocase subunit SecA